MPELPEVQTIVNDLNEANLIGKKVVEAEVFWPRSIATLDPSEFCKQIIGQKIKQISRRGKFIVFSLTKYTLLVHLRMTGKFKLKAAYEPHERVRLTLDDGRVLHYEDQRKFGKWYLLEKVEDKFSTLGIEPLSEEFTWKSFRDLCSNRSTMIKPFLLNQKYIVGLGNIYVDEALWEAKIHPQTKAGAISTKQLKDLYHAIPHVLKKGIEQMGTSLGSKNANYFSVSGRRGDNQHKLNVFRLEGSPCPRCGTTVIKVTVAQRGTHLCPECQAKCCRRSRD